eukprot:TRINITY_DN3967_c1_g1_i1.p1 TRINITY_DN3967_c1_g1~~TRINITY_DN3967_c1_g1_i1.p1  ORF type:complete len:470 (+),score=52.52 TRINITY_DN3967_c1_g1_i1:186-1595(+)
MRTSRIISADEIETHDRLLGEGQFGQVFEGRCRGTPVAIKFMKPETSNSEEMLKEVVAMSEWPHPNVVTLLGACVNIVEDKEQCWALVSELMEKDLSTLVYAKKEEDKLTLYQKFQALIDIASGMSWLQGKTRHVIHRDLKLENILVDRKGVCKISDFGFSTVVQGAEKVNCSTAGTPIYLSPEGWKSSVVPASDVYSFGIIIWEVIVGDIPYRSMNFQKVSELEKAVLAGTRPDIEAVPYPELKPLITACWHPDHHLRPKWIEVLNRIYQIRVDTFLRRFPQASELWSKNWIDRDSVTLEEFVNTQKLSLEEKEVAKKIIKALGVLSEGRITIEGYAQLLQWFYPSSPLPCDSFLSEVILTCKNNWFFGKVDGAIAESCLYGRTSGTYFVRLSMYPEVPFVISAIKNHSIIHVRVWRREVGFEVNSRHLGGSVSEVIPEIVSFLGLGRACPNSPFQLLAKPGMTPDYW